MRTTVEITSEQHVQLATLAAKRGMRGFSGLVQEAIERYVAEQDGDDVDAILALRGSLSEEEADELEGRIREAWSTWPATS